jgi:hypothetical protein
MAEVGTSLAGVVEAVVVVGGGISLVEAEASLDGMGVVEEGASACGILETYLSSVQEKACSRRILT